MKKTTKKRLLIAGIVLLAVLVSGAVVFNVVVDRMFSRITQSITDNGLLQNGENIEGALLTDMEFAQGLAQLIAQMDADDIKKLESKISAKDKVAVLSILAKSLPREEYLNLISYLSGGISPDEFSRTVDLLRKYLTPEDKAQIMQYYTKYLYLLEE